MYIIPIAWLYVVVMMALAEATNSNGSILGAVVTFVLYGLLPISLIVYFMGAPGRKRAIRAKDAAELAAAQAHQTQPTAETPAHDATASSQPDASSLSATDAVPPVGKEP